MAYDGSDKRSLSIRTREGEGQVACGIKIVDGDKSGIIFGVYSVVGDELVDECVVGRTNSG